ncbi:MAG: DUF2178 domain-containing protein [Candidatus Peribacteraceae bacterium]|jgi:uncharacterized membrane protein|nr:DUF2178 domain-containing protein [Candidatus Peribacteraceae bacterium]
MTLKQFAAVRLITVMLLSAFIAFSVASHEYFWPIIAMVLAILLLLGLRSRVKEILADERDYTLGGKAARWAMQIFSLVAVIVMFIFLNLGENNPQMTVVAHVLAYSVCALMLLYSALFGIFRRFNIPVR